MIATVRSEAAKAALLAEVLPGQDGDPSVESRLKVVLLDCGTAEGAQALAAYVKENGIALDHVVSSFGGGVKMGPVSSLSSADLHDAIDRAVPHLVLAQALLPLMKQESASSYTIVTGLLGENCFMPQFAGITVSNAAIFGLFLAVESENSGKPVRLYEMRIGAMISKDSQSDSAGLMEGTTYAASLIGEEAVDFALGKQKPGIVRIVPDALEARMPENK